MRIPDKWYNVLKWCVLIMIPAFTTAYVGMSAVWNWPYATEVAKTSAVICTLLGSLLGISTAEYNKDVLSEPEEYPAEAEDEAEEN